MLTQGDLSRIGQQFMYGAKQSMSIQTTGGLFKNVLKLTPSANYATKLNFQRIEKSYDAINNNTSIDTLESADLAHEFNLNISAKTMLYSYYNFLGKSQAKMRHIMTPKLSYRYVPLINPLISGNFGTWKSGNLESNRIPKIRILKIKIHFAQNVGKLWIRKGKNILAPFGSISGQFFHRPEICKKTSLIAYFPWCSSRLLFSWLGRHAELQTALA